MKKKDKEEIVEKSQKKKSKWEVPLYALIILVLLLTYKYCFGCFKVPIESKYNDYKPLIDEHIKVSIKEGTLTKKGMTLVIENTSSDRAITYGDVKVEPKILGMWGMFILKKSVITNGMLYRIPPGETKEIDMKWEEKLGRLSKGKYRVIMNAYTVNYQTLIKPNIPQEDIDTNTCISYEFSI